MQILRIAWDRWKIIGHINGDYIGRLTVVLFYYTIFALFALGARLLSDPLKLKRKPGWLDRTPVGARLDDARSQF